MKLSFSLASKSQFKKPSAAATSSTPSEASKAFESSKPTENNGSKQFLTEFDPSKPASETLIIPPKPNEYRSFKKMKNLDLPLTETANSQPLQFEIHHASIDVEQPPGSITYGLNVRQTNDTNIASGADSMLISYKEDMDRLPDGPGFDEYDDMPVEGFGAALLAGYGWKEGRGIGRNAKEDAKIVEYKKWTGKEGLGFQGEAPEKVPSSKKDGKNREEVRVESDHGRREEKGRGNVVIEQNGVDRRESNSRDRRDDRKEHISSSRRSTREDSNSSSRRSSREEHNSSSRRSTRDSRDEKVRNGRDTEVRHSRDEEVKDGRKKERRHRGGEDVEKEYKDERKGGNQQSRKSERVIWVRNHIRVRVISEGVKGGKFYLKKGEVVDVVGTSCDILMDGSRELVQGVNQDYLETALPKRGGPVLVLSGKHKGVYGSLVEKDSDKEAGVVRDADNHEMFSVRLDEIAEFVGDPSYIGY